MVIVNLPVAKVTVHFADGQSEENDSQERPGNSPIETGSRDVPGSKSAAELITHGQVRWFTKSLKHQDVIQSITLESFDNAVAPGFVAVTADTGAGSIAASDPPATAFKWTPGDTHLLDRGRRQFPRL